MKRSYDEKIKEAAVELTNSLFQQICDELFLVAMDLGTTIRTVYEQIDSPVEAIFDSENGTCLRPY